MSVPASDVTPGPFSGGLINATANGTDSYSIATQFNYTGGDSGFSIGGLRVTNETLNSGENFSWCIIGVQNNSSPKGENVAGYMQATRMTNTAGSTWAVAVDTIDEFPNPFASFIGVEVAMRGTGSSTNNTRRGIDLHAVNWASQKLVELGQSGANAQTAVINDGLRLNADDPNGPVQIQRGVSMFGNFVNGVDLENATFTGHAVNMNANQTIHFGHGMTMRYNGSNSRIEFLWGTQVAAYIQMTDQVGQLT